MKTRQRTVRRARLHALRCRAAPALKPIVVTLQEDGTIVGEMMTNQGPVKWTGEKLQDEEEELDVRSRAAKC